MICFDYCPLLGLKSFEFKQPLVFNELLKQELAQKLNSLKKRQPSYGSNISKLQMRK